MNNTINTVIDQSLGAACYISTLGWFPVSATLGYAQMWGLHKTIELLQDLTKDQNPRNRFPTWKAWMRFGKSELEAYGRQARGEISRKERKEDSMVRAMRLIGQEPERFNIVDLTKFLP